MGDADGFRVLVVCTANICRSPMAAALLRSRLASEFGVAASEVEVTSAGVRALIGEPMDPRAAALLAARAVEPNCGTMTDFTSRQLDDRLVAHADLVLTMTRDHRREVVLQNPAAQRRTYTLRELARIARAAPARPVAKVDGPADALRGLLAVAPALRGPTAPANAADDDVADPHRRSDSDYRRAVRTIGDAVDTVVKSLSWVR